MDTVGCASLRWRGDVVSYDLGQPRDGRPRATGVEIVDGKV